MKRRGAKRKGINRRGMSRRCEEWKEEERRGKEWIGEERRGMKMSGEKKNEDKRTAITSENVYPLATASSSVLACLPPLCTCKRVCVCEPASLSQLGRGPTGELLDNKCLGVRQVFCTCCSQ